MNRFLDDLRAVSDQVQVLNEQTYRIGTQEFTAAPQQAYQNWQLPLQSFGANTGNASQLRTNLQTRLAGALYARFYSTGRVDGTGAATPLHAPAAAADRDESIRNLSDANSSENRLDRCWTVYSIDGYGNTFVSKNGVLRQLMPNEWEAAQPSETGLQVGAVVHLKVVKEDTTVQPVFYHVRGNELVSQQAVLTRVYFHTDYEGARLLVRDLTATFNRYGVPFLFKCLNQPALFTRADSAVLYLDQPDFPFGSRLLRRMLPALQPFLQNPVPLFTRTLVPGVSFSEDPGNGQSFGMSRCSLLAEGLVDAFYRGAAPGEKQLEAVVTAFQRAGIDPQTIYLKPNSKFPYDFSVFAAPTPV